MLILQVDVGAFVMPNEDIDADTPLTAFVVPLEALETVAGLKFFPKTLTAAKRHSVDAAARRWQQAGLLGTKVSSTHEQHAWRDGTRHSPDFMSLQLHAQLGAESACRHDPFPACQQG